VSLLGTNFVRPYNWDVIGKAYRPLKINVFALEIYESNQSLPNCCTVSIPQVVGNLRDNHELVMGRVRSPGRTNSFECLVGVIRSRRARQWHIVCES
jgi:hypothetical protein